MASCLYERRLPPHVRRNKWLHWVVCFRTEWRSEPPRLLPSPPPVRCQQPQTQPKETMPHLWARRTEHFQHHRDDVNRKTMFSFTIQVSFGKMKKKLLEFCDVVFCNLKCKMFEVSIRKVPLIVLCLVYVVWVFRWELVRKSVNTRLVCK